MVMVMLNESASDREQRAQTYRRMDPERSTHIFTKLFTYIAEMICARGSRVVTHEVSRGWFSEIRIADIASGLRSPFKNAGEVIQPCLPTHAIAPFSHMTLDLKQQPNAYRFGRDYVIG